MPTSENSDSALPFVLRGPIIGLLIVIANAAAVRLDFGQPFVGYGIGGTFLLFLAARPKLRQVGIVSLAALMVAFFVFRTRITSMATLLVQLIGCLGLASLLYVYCKAVWEPSRQRRETLRILLPASVLTFMVFASVYSLGMASYLHARTLDLYAFVFDGSLGFLPSFILGRLVITFTWLFPLIKVSYEVIVLAMAAFYAAFMARRDKPIWELIELLFAAAMIGYVFFSVFPVCGPSYAFPAYFPGGRLPYPMLPSVHLQRVAIDWLIPRNGVPSLHFTWALLIWWNTRSLPRWGQALAFVFVLATVFDTLATGEHYLFDLIVALPFALWMQASMIRTVPFRERQRWQPALCGAAMFAAWLVLGRFGIPLLLKSRFIPWSLAIVSSLISIVWAFRLPALIPEMQIPASTPAKAKATACAG